MSPAPAPRALRPLVVLVLVASAMLLAARGARTDRADLPPYHSPMPIPQATLFGKAFLCTGDYESHAAFTPDAKTIYFVKSTPSRRFSTIIASKWDISEWTMPETPSFSGKWNDTDPFITADGARLFYSSNRPVDDFIGAEARKDMDLWVVDRTADGWSAPRHLDAPVNANGSDEGAPSVATDGTLYFASNRPGGKGDADLYRCRLVNGKYGPVESLGDSINTAAREFDPYIAPDQSYLVFAAAGRSDSKGGSDLYVSYRRGDHWSKAVNLGDVVNSPADDFAPLVSPDGEYFFFTSCRGFMDATPQRALQFPEYLVLIRQNGNGLGDLYQVDLSALRIRK